MVTEKTDLLTIEGFLRVGTGKGYNRKIRKRNLIPGSISDKGKATSIELDPKLLSKVWKNGKSFLLKLESKLQKVYIEELQVSVLKREALHVDLRPL